MAKYKNITRTKIILSFAEKLITVNPDQEIVLDYLPANYQSVLVEIFEPVRISSPKKKLKG